MLKQLNKNLLVMANGGALYEHARSDVFLHNSRLKSDLQEPLRAPSITAIVLLQCQATIIQTISFISSSQKLTINSQKLFIVAMALQHVARWTLLLSLLILDNVAHALNVEEEMLNLKDKGSCGRSDNRFISRSNGDFFEPCNVSSTLSAESDHTAAPEKLRPANEESNENASTCHTEQRIGRGQALGRTLAKPKRCARPCCDDNPLKTKKPSTTASTPFPTPSLKISTSPRHRKVSSPSFLASGERSRQRSQGNGELQIAGSRKLEYSSIKMLSTSSTASADSNRPISLYTHPTMNSKNENSLASTHHTLRRITAQRELGTSSSSISSVESDHKYKAISQQRTQLPGSHESSQEPNWCTVNAMTTYSI